MFRIAIVVATIALAGCQQQLAFERIDGRSVRTDPDARAKFEQDRAICKGEGSKAFLNSAGNSTMVDVHNVATGCMAERGYRRVAS